MADSLSGSGPGSGSGSLSGSTLKPVARMHIFKDPLKIFAVSLLFVLFFALVSRFQAFISGASGLYPRYMERVAAGEPHSLGMLFSFISPAGAGVAAVLWFAAVVLKAAFMLYCLTRINRKPVGGAAPVGAAFFGKLILIAALKTALTALWSLLFFFPGAAAHYRYRQAYYILMDDPGKSALRCISESKLLMAGNKLDLFLLDLSFLGWHALSAALSAASLLILPFPLPILSVWVLPYAGFTRALYYGHLLGKAAA